MSSRLGEPPPAEARGESSALPLHLLLYHLQPIPILLLPTDPLLVNLPQLAICFFLLELGLLAGIGYVTHFVGKLALLVEAYFELGLDLLHSEGQHPYCLSHAVHLLPAGVAVFPSVLDHYVFYLTLDKTASHRLVPLFFFLR